MHLKTFLGPVPSSSQSISPWRATATQHMPQIMDLGRHADTIMRYVDIQSPELRHKLPHNTCCKWRIMLQMRLTILFMLSMGMAPVNISVSGEKTEFSLERGIDDLIKGFTMIKNTKYSNV